MKTNKASIPLLLMLATAQTHAGTISTQPPTPVDEWEIRAALYGWATALDGDVTLRGNQLPVDVAFEDILENLDFAFMGVLEVSNGEWGLLADLFYAELSARNSSGNRSFHAEMDQFIGNLVVTRNVLDDGPTRFDVFAGARVTSIEADLDIQTNFIGTFSGSASETWLDPIVGVRFQQELCDKFFFRGVADIGGFGVSSDLTWQALLGLGYRVTDSASVLLGYRGLGTDYKNGNFGYDVVSHGFLLGFESRF